MKLSIVNFLIVAALLLLLHLAVRGEGWENKKEEKVAEPRVMKLCEDHVVLRSRCTEASCKAACSQRHPTMFAYCGNKSPLDCYCYYGCD